MSKITLDNLSDNLKAYLEGLGLSEEQVLNLINENGLDEEELKAMLKDTMSINELNTNSKTVIGAINELFQSANNGKQLIANAIGEPVSAEDTFSAMSNDIKGLLSTFKTNMMNAGVVVENGDKFKALIDKIKGLTEGEGNKGIQFANGEGEWETVSVNSDYRVTIPTNLDFTPTYIFCLGVFEFHDNIYDSDTHVGNMVLSNIERGTGSNMSIGIIDITPESFTIELEILIDIQNLIMTDSASQVSISQTVCDTKSGHSSRHC